MRVYCKRRRKEVNSTVTSTVRLTIVYALKISS
jgi:hypothetical protein